MIKINTFTIANDFLTLDVEIDAGVGQTVDTLYFYVGDRYLSSVFVDLSSRLSGIQQENLTITKGELGITSDVIDGIITVYTVASDTTEVEASLFNSYFASLVLARMIALNNIETSYEQIAIIFFLLEATKTYINSGFTEEALNTFTKVQALCENYPDYMITTDVPECSVGSGCWIINGKYIIH